jgi:hypothetical protein
VAFRIEISLAPLGLTQAQFKLKEFDGVVHGLKLGFKASSSNLIPEHRIF